MKRLVMLASLLGLSCLLAVGPRPVAAEPAGPEIVIAQLKVTSSDGQFLSLYNDTDNPIDMARYQIQYFNNYDLTKAATTKLIRLHGIVPAHSYFMLSDDTLTVCYRMTVQSTSLGFSATAGMVQLVRLDQAQAGSAVTSQMQDYVAWSKAAATGVQALPSEAGASLRRLPATGDGAPAVTAPGSGSWQGELPSADGCSYQSVSSDAGGTGALLPGSEPPASSSTPRTGVPDADKGLQAPLVTELLPNPSGTGNDDSDEFVELYNSNQTAFDLSGFILEAGLTSLHRYTFPAGSSLAPQAFASYTAAQTHLSLSNSAGQLKLLDPSGKPVSTTDKYSSAKDGQAWALANGRWQWTVKPTPGAANNILAPTTTQKATKSSGVSGARTGRSGTKSADASTAAQVLGAAPIHPVILVSVALLALLYGAYEYRHDIRNRYIRARRNRAARRELRPEVTRR